MTFKFLRLAVLLPLGLTGCAGLSVADHGRTATPGPYASASYYPVAATNAVVIDEPSISIFEAGKEDFRRFRYRNCKSKMEDVSSRLNAPSLKAEALFYAGLCSFYLSQRTEAERLFSQSAWTYPPFEPNNNIFTPEVINLYHKIHPRRMNP